MSKQPQNIVVTGASGGIGRALLEALMHTFPQARFEATYHRNPVELADARLRWQRLDLRDQDAIEAWARGFERVDWLVNCAGFLHGDIGGPEKSIRAVDGEFLLESVRINALPTLLLARFFAAALKRSPAPLLAAISARVGSRVGSALMRMFSSRKSLSTARMDFSGPPISPCRKPAQFSNQSTRSKSRDQDSIASWSRRSSRCQRSRAASRSTGFRW